MTHKQQTQLEIFEQSHRIKKGPRPHSDTLEKVADFKFPAQLCIKLACIIIVVIISFALGVERGKILSKKKVSTRVLADREPAKINKEVATKNDKIQKVPLDNKKLEKKEESDKIQHSGYIIQVASYKKNSSYIDREIAKLKRNGYDTITISGNKYMGICAGKFSNKKEAQKYLKQLQRTYKDCFIRKI
ncbi:SPOR domain-containing protein [Candidatus Omnitrophota bacterium]